MSTIQDCYRGFLKNVLVERISTNPSYSLRALARDLSLAPSSLSEVLSGKKKFSASTALKIAKVLKLSEPEQEQFVLLVQMDSTKSPEMKDVLQRRLKTINPSFKPKDLTVEIFKVISEWYHFAILEMTSLSNIDHKPKIIANKLGITPLEAETAISRLLELELLTKDKQGKLKKTNSKILVESQIPNNALRLFHKQMLEKAIDSLESQTPQEKIVGSETFAINSSLLDEANRLTNLYFDEMVNLSKKSKHKLDVYHLGVQFFRLTQKDVE